MPAHDLHPTIHIPGTTTHTIAPRTGRASREGTLRYLKAGTGTPSSCCTPSGPKPSTSAFSSH